MSKIWAKLVECGSDIHKRKSAVQLLYAEILILATGHKSQGVRYRTIWTIENQEDLGHIPEGYVGVSSSVCLTVWACWHQAHRHVDTFCAEKAADWPHGALQSLPGKFVWWMLHLGQNHFSTWLFGYPRISLLFVYYNMIHISLFMLPLFVLILYHCLSLYTSDLVFSNFIQQKPPGAALQISSPWLLRGAGACPADIGRHRSGGRLSLDEKIEVCVARLHPDECLG